MRTSYRVIVAFVALALLLLSSSPASAGRQWCQLDPAFLIGGTQVNVDVAVLEDDLPYISGPTSVTLIVPKGTAASLLFTDAGFNGYGEVVSIVESDSLRATKRVIPIVIKVVVPATRAVRPVNVKVTDAMGRTVSVNGRANATITVVAAVTPSV